MKGPTKTSLFNALKSLNNAPVKPFFNVLMRDNSPATLWPLVTRIEGSIGSNDSWKISIAFEVKYDDQLLLKNFPKKLWKKKQRRSRLKKQYMKITAMYSTKTRKGFLTW